MQLPDDNGYGATIDAVARGLDVDPDRGLSGKEASQRRQEHGPNAIQRAQRRGAWRILLDQFKNFVVLLLLAASVASAALGNVLEGIAIAVALFINACIGFATEFRAAKSLEALRRLGQPETVVCRDGKERTIDVRDVVPGDVVLLGEGDVVPADARVLVSEGLECNEAALTGESMPVPKASEPVDKGAELAERSNMTYRGTTVTRGHGRALVTATGMGTEIGKIASMVEGAQSNATPLEKRMDRLASRLLWVALAVGVILAAVGLLAGHPTRPMIETAIIMAIAAVPEGLPIVATVALARGVWRMARKRALVNRLSSVEALGAISVILSDKTGTLTENKMSVRRLSLGDDTEIVVEADDAPADDDELVREVACAVTLCNGASLADAADADDDRGDPTELALLAFGRERGLDREALVAELEQLREESFTPDTMMMATFHRDERDILVAVKGAPEAVLDRCTRLRTRDGEVELTDEAREAFSDRNAALAQEGLRVLGVATKRADDDAEDPYVSLTLLGLIGLRDPPRPDVGEALARCRDAGIRVVLVTGDQPATAGAIAAELGIAPADARPCSGADLDAVLDGGVEDVAVFARVSPAQKLQLVEAYQDAGEIVGMTGDGVNDAPALKKADVGIAMGRRGTEAAREASDIVLEDDSFATIVEAIARGRTIFDNIRRFIIYLLSGNLGEILAVGAASLAGAPLPLLPLQILFINLLFDVFPALALGVGPGDPASVMRRPPRRASEPLLTRKHWGLVTAYGVLIAGSVLGVFVVGWSVLEVGQERVVTISFLAFGLARLLHVFNMRDPSVSLLRSDVVRSGYIWGAAAVCAGLLGGAVLIPSLSTILAIAPLQPVDWLLIVVGGAFPLVVVQFVMIVMRMAGKKAQRPTSLIFAEIRG